MSIAAHASAPLSKASLRLRRLSARERRVGDSREEFQETLDLDMRDSGSKRALKGRRPPIWVSKTSAAGARSTIVVVRSGIGAPTCSEICSTCATMGSVAGVSDSRWSAFSAICDEWNVSYQQVAGSSPAGG